MTKTKALLAGAGIAIIALLRPGALLNAGPVAKPALMGGIVSPGKPGAQVTLISAVRPPGHGKAKVAQRLDINLQLSVPAGAQALAVTVSAGGGMALVSGGHAQFTQPEGILRHEVSVVPQTDGRHYLSVSVSLQRHGETRMRAFAVPVRVGSQGVSARAAAKGLVTRNSDGEAVIITHSR